MALSPDSPPVWRHTDTRGDLYIFGAIHALPPDLFWITPTVRSAIDSARHVFFEAPFGESWIARIAAIPSTVIAGSQTLWDLLGEADSARLRSIAEGLGVSPTDLRLQKPYFAANLIENAAIARATGASGRFGVEAQVTRLLRARPTQFGALEDRLTATRILGDVRLEIQVEYLSRLLRRIDDQVALRRSIVSAWRAGDMASLSDLIEQDVQRFRQLGVLDAMFAGRHQRWLKAIGRRPAGVACLVCVGLSHLFGPGNFPAVLTQAGLNPRRL